VRQFNAAPTSVIVRTATDVVRIQAPQHGSNRFAFASPGLKDNETQIDAMIIAKYGYLPSMDIVDTLSEVGM
jgi:hypothetical protein